jgi:RNA polymerase sigma-70 factor, ECF subfamily
MTTELQTRAERDALDARVMVRICEGDDSALAELYDRHSAMALGLALRIVRDQLEAEDVVHDAFIAVVERADQFRPERGTVIAWLVTTVRNLALDRARRRVRRAQITDDELRHERPEPIADPETLSELARDRAMVVAALAKLSEAQRQTLEIAFFEGLSYPEIAERENIPLGTVKSRAARALAALRAALEETAGERFAPTGEGAVSAKVAVAPKAPPHDGAPAGKPGPASTEPSRSGGPASTARTKGEGVEERRTASVPGNKPGSRC